MLTADFQYDLPEDRIAKYPLPERAASRLLVYRQEHPIEHARFFQIGQYLPKEAVLVLNDTRVLPARLPMLTSQGNPVEILLLEPLEMSATQALGLTRTSVWKVMVGGKRKWKGEVPVMLDSHTKLDAQAFWHDRDQDLIRLEWQPEDLTLAEVLDQVGQMPLPPYLNRKANLKDKERYQTVFAREAGAVAAPTAALHLTPELLQELEAAGHPNLRITLHVGAGTFKPVTSEHIEDHVMHAERYALPVASLRALAKENRPIIPVGTTSLRLLETIYWRGLSLLLGQGDLPDLPTEAPYQMMEASTAYTFSQAASALAHHLADDETCTGSTALFIRPGYRIQSSAGIITNFHQPGSTLIALIAAIVGPAWRDIYAQALREGYRFLSYGDSSLLLRPSRPL